MADGTRDQDRLEEAKRELEAALAADAAEDMSVEELLAAVRDCWRNIEHLVDAVEVTVQSLVKHDGPRVAGDSELAEALDGMADLGATALDLLQEEFDELTSVRYLLEKAGVEGGALVRALVAEQAA